MSQALRFLDPGSRMARRAKEFDWSTTSLGPVSDWPPELITVASLVLESRFPAALIWGPDLTTIYNDAFRPILGGKGDVFGRPFSEIWAEAWHEIGPIAERAFAGEATFIEDFPLTIERFGYPEPAYFTFCYSPVRLADGSIGGMIDTVTETTQAVLAREHADVLNRELGHRLKNSLSIVQSIASQSLRTVQDRAPVEAFQQRIKAMGKAHDVLQRQNWDCGTIQQVAEQVLSLHGGQEHFRISGKDVAIGSKAVLALSLLLHELATNAAKYGALSVAEGYVELNWRVAEESGEDMLILTWRECHGPPSAEPLVKGFGSRLIRMGLGCACAVETRFLASGFEADFRTPLKTL